MDRLLLLTNPPMATTSQDTNAGPKYEDSPQTEREEDLRDWAGLNEDLLSEIFRRMGTIAGACRAGSVCQAWRKTAKNDDQLWRRIDMTHNDYSHDPVVGFTTKPETLSDRARRAIDTSGCRLKEFWVESFCDDKLLQYLYDRRRELKSLRITYCYLASDEGIIAAVRGQSCLEELEITYGHFTLKLPKHIGKELPNLKILKYNKDWRDVDPCFDNMVNVEAFGIATTMHQLRHLQLINNIMTNEGLKAILEGCPLLETLDIRGSQNVKMDSAMWARCVRLTTFRPPEDSLDDYECKDDCCEFMNLWYGTGIPYEEEVYFSDVLQKY